MPKCTSSKLPSLRKWIEPYNRSGEVFKTLKNNSVFCQYCNKVVVVEKKFQIDQHVRSFSHEKYSKTPNSKQTFVNQQSTSSENQSIFFQELCSALIASSIPLHKLQNTNFRSFLKKYTHLHISDESTLRKNYVIKCYTDVLTKI